LAAVAIAPLLNFVPACAGLDSGELALGQPLNGARLGQSFAEHPDRVGIRHRITEPEPQEPHPGEPIAQVELTTLVGQVVLGLQNQDLEHQDVVEWWPAALRSIRPGHGALELGPEQLEIDHDREPLEVIALLRQAGQTILNVEKPSPADPFRSSSLHAEVDQITPLPPRFLEVSS
jgi:hypothetical protein